MCECSGAAEGGDIPAFRGCTRENLNLKVESGLLSVVCGYQLFFVFVVEGGGIRGDSWVYLHFFHSFHAVGQLFVVGGHVVEL